jgi:uncharacterized membrane protein
MKMRYYAACALMVAAALAAFFYVLPGLPERVPVHWNLHGEADRYGSPWSLLVLGPVLMAGTMVLFAVLPWLSPKHFEVDSSLRAYLAFMLILVGMFGYFFAVSLWAAMSGPVGAPRAVIGGVCVLSILLGNLMGKVRRNFFLGVRTPWTLASERVWYATHRLAAKTLVAAGVIGLALSLASAPAWLSVAIVALGAVVPAVYSLVHYKRLERAGQLDIAA